MKDAINPRLARALSEASVTPAPALPESTPATPSPSALAEKILGALPPLEAAECRVLLKTIRECGGDVTRTAQTLGKNRTNLHFTIRRRGIQEFVRACREEIAGNKTGAASAAPQDTAAAPPSPASDSFKDARRQVLLETIQDCKGDIAAAAEKLGRSRTGIYQTMRRHGISVADVKAKPA
jgi:transcriptional regulator of acetoin/glycerol metabolism